MTERNVLVTGDAVEVFVRFTDTWADGYEIADIVDDAYRVRRTSDGSLLPSLTSRSDLRPPRQGYEHA